MTFKDLVGADLRSRFENEEHRQRCLQDSAEEFERFQARMWPKLAAWCTDALAAASEFTFARGDVVSDGSGVQLRLGYCRLSFAADYAQGCILASVFPSQLLGRMGDDEAPWSMRIEPREPFGYETPESEISCRLSAFLFAAALSQASNAVPPSAGVDAALEVQ